MCGPQPWFEDPLPAPPRVCDFSRWWECENRLFSAMLTPDPLHVVICPTRDDLMGLSALYPSCSGQVMVPQCVPTARNLAWWRFTLLFGIPTILVLMLLPIATWFARKCIRWYEVGPNAQERAILDAVRTLMAASSSGQSGAYRNAIDDDAEDAAAPAGAPAASAPAGGFAMRRRTPASFRGAMRAVADGAREVQEQAARTARSVSFRLSVELERRRAPKHHS